MKKNIKIPKFKFPTISQFFTLLGLIYAIPVNILIVSVILVHSTDLFRDPKAEGNPWLWLICGILYLAWAIYTINLTWSQYKKAPKH